MRQRPGWVQHLEHFALRAGTAHAFTASWPAHRAPFVITELVALPDCAIVKAELNGRCIVQKLGTNAALVRPLNGDVLSIRAVNPHDTLRECTVSIAYRVAPLAPSSATRALTWFARCALVAAFVYLLALSVGPL